jgi:hypothetical protein
MYDRIEHPTPEEIRAAQRAIASPCSPRHERWGLGHQVSISVEPATHSRLAYCAECHREMQYEEE